MKELLNLAVHAAKRAGKKILKHYEDYETHIKNDKSPITTADIAANDAIMQILSQSRIPICSEEAILEYEIRREAEMFWLVDPLDGTREFIAKNGEFCVCIALISNGKPIISAIHIPTTDETFYARKNDSVYKNGKILVQPNSSKDSSNFIMGRIGHSKKREFLANKYNYNIIRIGSAIKFCRMVELRGGVYLRLGDSSLWDIAAGDLLLTQSGGIIIDLATKRPPRYDGKNLINNHFLALSKDNIDKLDPILEYLKEFEQYKV